MLIFIASNKRVPGPGRFRVVLPIHAQLDCSGGGSIATRAQELPSRCRTQGSAVGSQVWDIEALMESHMHAIPQNNTQATL